MGTTHFERFSKYYAMIFLAGIAILSSLVRFGWMYPDSEKYIFLVSFFRGEIDGSELVSPFCYRPLLPFIAALIPVAPELTFSIVNLLCVIGLSWVIMYIVMEFDFSLFTSFVASAVCTASWVVAYYGTAVLVDTGAMLFLGIGLLLILRESHGVTISGVLVIGVLFKEIALIGVIAHFLYAKKKDAFVLIAPIATYLILRLVTPTGNPEFAWLFHLGNFSELFYETTKTLVLTLGIFTFLIMISLIWRNENQEKYNEFLRWVVFVGIPALGIFCLGLFFASFDARFVWPLYFAMLPIVAAGIEQVDKFLGLSRYMSTISKS